MISFEYIIKDEHGIHARPATDLFKMTKNYDCTFTVTKGDKTVPFKGVMGVMSLGASFDGPDEAAAKEAFEKFVSENL